MTVPDSNHVAAIRRALEHERRHGGSLALDQIEKRTANLAAERDALLAYATEVEHAGIRGIKAGEITRIRARYPQVAHLFDTP